MIPDARFRTIVALLGVLVLSWAALSGPGSADAAALTVSITDGLSPKSVTVPPGTTVTFVNDDAERHRVRTTSGPSEFDSGNLEPGERFSVTLQATGRYSYRDERNAGDAAYFGSITVSSSASATTVDPQAPTPTTLPAPSSVSVSIGNRVYVPFSVTVAPGGTVTWTNDDDRPHTVTANDRSFDSGIMEAGATWSRTFPNGGTFAYFCELHPDMTGSVTVATSTGGGGTPTTTPPPPPTATVPPATTQPPGTTVPGGPTVPAAASVAISGNLFSPQVVTIAVGGTVTWTNQDTVPHTATSTTGQFASGFMRLGDQFSQRFDTIGSYAYFCELHPEMTATVRVVAPDTPAPPTTQPTVTTAPAHSTAHTTVPPSANQTATTTPSGSGVTLPSTGSVAIVGNRYSPQTITIAVGGTVTWVNQDAVPHTVTATDRSFDSGIMMQGDRWSRTFASSGTYTYFCEIHPEMTATVVVTTPNAAQPPIVTASGSTSTGGGGTGQQGNAGSFTSSPVASSNVPGAASVGMADNQFQPVAVTIGMGGVVTWTNTDTIPHTVTADDGSFDSGIMMPGDTFTRTFSSPGTVGYRCTLHPGMTGTVEVLAEAAGSSVAATDDHGSGSAASATAASGPVVVSLEDGAVPAHVVITAGQSVTWVNNDDVAHNVTAKDGSFRSQKFMGPGSEFEHVFLEPGIYEYGCDIHDDMAGTVEVVAPGTTDDQGAISTVIVTDTGFEPPDIVVQQGDTVRWEFTGVLPHTVTADDGSFDSGILEPGDVYEFRFDTLGTFRYTCLLHPAMIGTITVVPPDVEPADGAAAVGEPSSGIGSDGDSSGGGSKIPILMIGLFAGIAASMVFGFGAAIAKQGARSATVAN